MQDALPISISVVMTLVTLASSGPPDPGSARAPQVPLSSGENRWSIVGSPALVDSSSTTGCAWGDYDGDGDDDIFFSNGDVQGNPHDQLIRNDGGGAFTIVNTGVLESPGPERAAYWGDYDNDGDLDLLSASWGPERLYRNDGLGHFQEVVVPAFQNGSDTFGAAWVDIDNDGDLDLSFAHEDQPPQLMRNDGSFGFTEVTPPSFLELNPSFSMATAWSDIDGDRDQDVYIVRNSLPNVLLRNDGGFEFTDITAPPIGTIGAGHGASWGDADGDGLFDLYVTNLGTGNRLFRNLGNGTFSDMTFGEPAASGYSAGCAWGDYDNDGRLDLYFTNAFAVNKLLHNEGNFQFTFASEGPLLLVGVGGGTSFCDFDLDGDLDLLLANLDEPQSNRLFRNGRAPDSGFLEVSLAGTTSNRYGIGARIGVWANGLEQWREISAGSGFSSEDPLRAHFGLGDAPSSGSGIDSVEVQWPSGIDQVVRDIAVNQRITIVETDPATGIPGHDEGTPASLTTEIVSIRPNPFRDAASIVVRLTRAGVAGLAIFDVQGRRVRHWNATQLPEGESVISWDGADEDGAPLPAGVYWARLQSEATTRTRKLVLIQ